MCAIKSLTKLNLNGNERSSDGFVHILYAIDFNMSLTELGVFSNRIDDEGEKALLKVLE